MAKNESNHEIDLIQIYGLDDAVTRQLRANEGGLPQYGDVDEIELYPGLFAEDVRRNAVLPPLVGRMVAIDAFSQAFTNPLLSPRVFNAETFSPLGWNLIRTTSKLSDLAPQRPGRRASREGEHDALGLGPDLTTRSEIGDAHDCRGLGPADRPDPRPVAHAP